MLLCRLNLWTLVILLLSASPTLQAKCHDNSQPFSEQNAARSTVPGGPSVACSTAKALEWDAAWAKNPDPSGRAALGVHAAAYEEAAGSLSEADGVASAVSYPQKLQEGVIQATATAV